PLRQRLARLHRHRVAARAHRVEVAPGLAGADVELPAVPRAAQHLALPYQAELAGTIRLGETDEHATAQRRALVRAAIYQREMLAADVEHADLAALHRDDLAVPRRDLAHAGDDMPGHRSGEAVQRHRVVAEQLAPELLGQRHLDREARIVLVPMRIVGREHDAV